MTATPKRTVTLTLLPTPLTILQLGPTAPVPEWTTAAKSFLSVTRTPEELSLVVEVASLPADVRVETSYLAFRVLGPLPLELVGVLAAVAAPLAAAGVPIFPIATYNTDYVLVREADAGAACQALAAGGHQVVPLGSHLPA